MMEPSTVSSPTISVTCTDAKYAKWEQLYKDSFEIFEQKSLLCGTVVHGFKRGSKELGIPTANISMEDLGDVGQSFKTGVYFGFAYLNGVVYKAVLSVGWNPHFGNTQKSVEVHLLATLDDFYGCRISVLICGYLRDEQPFSSLGDLIDCIHCDITTSTKHLNEESSLLRLQDVRLWAEFDLRGELII